MSFFASILILYHIHKERHTTHTRAKRLTHHINTAEKMKFSIKDFSSKSDQIVVRLVRFTEEILNGKLYFLCSVTLPAMYPQQLTLFH